MRIPDTVSRLLSRIASDVAAMLPVLVALGLAIGLAAPESVDAQMFGRNKVQYESFDWKVMRTEHFDIHYYPQEEAAVRDAARMAERWYTRLSTFFRHRFTVRKPIVFYADQGDFQQTNTIGGDIGEGTGGVTESLKDRVILPMTGSYAETDHVIGHELVHAFQYDMAKGAGGAERSLGILPLWFVEGMAEYLSIGREDPHTAMWLRDALIRDDLPTLDQLTTGFKYFPYRYGQAFWSFIAGRWGDGAVRDAMKGGLAVGWQAALRRITKMDDEALSKEWINAIKADYGPLVAGRTRPKEVGGQLFDDSRNLNVAPSISHDGKYLAFLSTRDIFTIDLYLADAKTGEVIEKLLSADADPHVDALRFVSSSGSWSPDSRKFAFTLYAEGNDQLAIVDVATRSIERRLEVAGIGGITNPSWSPDGKTIAFSGSMGGISDLYLLDVATGTLTRLTDDRYSDLQPDWSPDGRSIAFATDRGAGTDFTALTYSKSRLAIIDVATRAVRVLTPFASGKHINPQYSADGASLYFISDHDGFNDIYRLSVAGGEIYRLTSTATGVSGISAGSPAMTVASVTGQMVFSIFSNGNYSIHSIDATGLTGDRVTGAETIAGAAFLPPITRNDTSAVTLYRADALTGLPQSDTFKVTPYKASISLDAIGTPTVGASIGSYGPQLGGGISAYLSDMLGNHEIAAMLQLQGSFSNLGGQVQYLNREQRWNWGVLAGHIPYITPYTSTGVEIDTIDGQEIAGNAIYEIQEKTFVDQGALLAQYPYSTTHRFEASLGYTRVSFSVVADRYFFVGGEQVSATSVNSESTPDDLNFFEASVADVGDNSYFGFTSPVRGRRYRLELGATTGTATYGTLMADFRNYAFLRPVTFAVRAMHFGRYGKDADNTILRSLYLGYESLVRGYSAGSFDPSECSGTVGCPEFDRLLGSRLALASAEVRFPLFGTSDFGLIDFPYLPTELSFFADGGVAWTGAEGGSPTFTLATRSTDRIPVFSAGVSARVNLFGYIIGEIFYVYPFQRPDKGWHWGFQISPGW